MKPLQEFLANNHSIVSFEVPSENCGRSDRGDQLVIRVSCLALGNVTAYHLLETVVIRVTGYEGALIWMVALVWCG